MTCQNQLFVSVERFHSCRYSAELLEPSIQIIEQFRSEIILVLEVLLPKLAEGRARQRGTIFGFGGTSPLRRPSTSPLGGRKSPINRSSTPKKSAGKTRTPTSWSKDIQAQIEKLMAKYDIKRREYQRDLDYTLMEREEHAKQGDQTLADKNRGRYAYVHNKV